MENSPPQASPIGNIELALFAPYNEAVCLIADWNNWQRQPMSKGDDGWWRISVHLDDGQYLYKFAVKSKSYFAQGQWVEVFDPYALSITDDDKEQTHLTVRNSKRVWIDYQWQYDDVPLPRNEELIIYELHVGDFTGGPGATGSPRVKGTFRGVLEKLDYLADLGINAVEVMPVKEFPGKSWGYNLRSLFALDSSYGTPTDFCRLVDGLHSKGIRIIIDGVYNQAEADAPMAKIDYEYWFYKDNPDPKEWHWGPKYNYQHFDENLKIFPARKYVLESIRDWVTHFHIDGIRFDATRAIRYFDVMHEFSDMAFKMVDGRKPFFTVAEHVPEDPAIVGYPRGPMVAAWHDSLGKQLQALAIRHDRDGSHPWDLDALAQKLNPATNGYGSGNHTVNYVVSHDQERLMRQIGEVGQTFGEAAFRRVKLATAILLTSPGLPQLWMGQEFGVPNPKSLTPQPIDWNLLKNQNNRDLYDYVASVVKLRRHEPALSGDHFEVVLKDAKRCLFAYKRWNDAGGIAVVVANLRDKPAGEFTIAECGLPDGRWREHGSDTEIEVKGGVLTGELTPSEVKIFIKQ
jgi:1,4-alpha-glucan branching enzyme